MSRFSIALVLVLNTTVWAGELRLERAQVISRRMTEVKITYHRSGQALTGVQFELDLKGQDLALVGARVGPAARAAEKELHWAQITSGVTRLLIAGLNQREIKDGVVAILRIRTFGPAPRAVRLVMRRAVGTDRSGQSSSLIGRSTVLRVTEDSDKSRSLKRIP